jgi:hypothetical protein
VDSCAKVGQPELGVPQIMPAEPVDSASEGLFNPYAPPLTDTQDHWVASDPEMEEIRRAHVAEESYVQALEISNCVYILIFGANGCYYSYTLVGHLTGRISAAWILRPDWIALQIDQLGIVVLGIVAVRALRNLTKWACRVEALLVLFLFIWMALGLLITPLTGNTFDFPSFFGGSLFGLFLATPTFNLLDIHKSVIFERDYRRVVAATPHIKAYPNLPGDLKVIMVLSFVGFLVFGFVNPKFK